MVWPIEPYGTDFEVFIFFFELAIKSETKSHPAFAA